MKNELIGKHVMIRTYSAGVHYGVLADYEDKDAYYSVKLTNSIRVYSWAGACSLNQLASEGTEDDKTKLSVEIPSIYLKAIEIIEMTDAAVESLSNLKTWSIQNI